MSFYTSVVRYGNSMLYRGYDANGKRIYRKDHFQPEFFVPSQKDTGWKSATILFFHIQSLLQFPV